MTPFQFLLRKAIEDPLGLPPAEREAFLAEGPEFLPWFLEHEQKALEAAADRRDQAVATRAKAQADADAQAARTRARPAPAPMTSEALAEIVVTTIKGALVPVHERQARLEGQLGIRPPDRQTRDPVAAMVRVIGAEADRVAAGERDKLKADLAAAGWTPADVAAADAAYVAVFLAWKKTVPALAKAALDSSGETEQAPRPPLDARIH